MSFQKYIESEYLPYAKKYTNIRASSVLLFPTFWGLSYFFLLLGKIPTFSGFYVN